MNELKNTLFIAAATLAFCGVWMSAPLAAVLLSMRGATPALVGLYAATGWLGAILSAPCTPWFAVRAGGALALHRIAGLASAACLLGLAADPPLWLWFILSPLLGAASCLTWTTADAIAGALAKPGQEGRFLGIYQTFVSAAIGGGPAMLWFTGIHAGAFAGCAAFMTLGFLTSLTLHEIPGATPRRMRLSIPRLRPVLMMMRAPAGAAMLCGCLEGIAGTVFPVQGLALGMTAAAAASIVVATGLGNMLAQMPVGMAADRLGIHRALLGCTAAIATGALLWPMLAPHWTIWPTLALWGGAAGAIYTLGMVRAVQRFAGPARAMGMASLNTAYLAGGALGTPLAGLLLQVTPGWGLPLTIAVLTIAAGTTLSWAALRRGG